MGNDIRESLLLEVACQDIFIQNFIVIFTNSEICWISKMDQALIFGVFIYETLMLMATS